MNRFWKWILKESGYVWMYLAMLSFLTIAIYEGTLIFIVVVSITILASIFGVHSHYKTLKKLGKWDENSDYDKIFNDK